VGTTSPNAKLEVAGTGQFLTGASGIQLYGTGGSGNINSLGANDLVVMVDGDEKMRVRDSGNVGVGTSIPGEKLEVDGNVKATGRVYSNTYFESTDNAVVLAPSEAGTVYLRPNGADTGAGAFSLNSSGNATFAGDVSMVGGNSTGKFAVGTSSVHPSFDFYNQGTAYFNGATTVDDTLTVTGNIGVGTTSPNAKLDVNGAIRVGTATTTAATANNVGAMRFRDTGSRNYLEMVFKTGANTYAWTVIKEVQY